MFYSTRISLLFVLLCLSVVHSQAGTGLLSAGKWDVFEVNLTTTKTYSNPYVDVRLNATFFGPDNAKIVIDGFWDGANTWKIRMAPTDKGIWSYKTYSNDAMLDGNTGSYRVLDSEKKGFVKVNPDYPYSFMYDDGTPFFWMGDTLWNDPGYPLFTQYIDLIKSNNYNVYHNYILDWNISRPNENGLPFEMINTTTRNFDMLRPEYFQAYEKRIRYANENDIITNIFFTPPEFFTLFTRQQFERYERYLVARYCAYNVMWVISGEYTEQSFPSEYAYHGNRVHNVDPYKHPISLHPGGNQSTSTHFTNDTWNSYIMQQVGSQFKSSRVNTSIINDRKYNKPIVNGEAAYLGQIFVYGNGITVDEWRKQNWMITISGGFMTTGYNNVFWTEYGFDLDDPDNLKGMSQMKNLYNFFNSIEFWKMDPDNSIINNGYALARSNKEYVIYLPEGGPTTVDLSSSNGSLNSEWYNPRTGVYQGQRPVQGGASLTFTSPDTHDWVLHIKEDTGAKAYFLNLWKTFMQQIFPGYEIGA